MAGTLDEHLWKTLEAAVGFNVPRGENGDTVNCPVAQLQGQSYQEWVVRLPVRLLGCGPAYLGALETAIPYMAARDKLCPTREIEWGGEECWEEAADPGSRWRVLLQSGCLEGVELRRWW